MLGGRPTEGKQTDIVTHRLFHCRGKGDAGVFCVLVGENGPHRFPFYCVSVLRETGHVDLVQRRLRRTQEAVQIMLPAKVTCDFR